MYILETFLGLQLGNVSAVPCRKGRIQNLTALKRLVYTQEDYQRYYLIWNQFEWRIDLVNTAEVLEFLSVPQMPYITVQCPI